MPIEIGRARPDDEGDLIRLLELNQLPTQGLHDHLSTARVARRNRQLVGSAALEMYFEGALLRSVAVAPPLQGQGVGHDLTNAAIQLAHELDAPALYLLTTTAERFFPKFGFERITRADVQASVHTSVEFTSACPSSATVMCKSL